MVNGTASAVLKRLEKLEELIRWRRPRFITIAVSAEEGGLVTEETMQKVAEIEREIGVSDQDQIVLVTRFTQNIDPYLVAVV
jgi:hypothetical protein